MNFFQSMIRTVVRTTLRKSSTTPLRPLFGMDSIDTTGWAAVVPKEDCPHIATAVRSPPKTGLDGKPLLLSLIHEFTLQLHEKFSSMSRSSLKNPQNSWLLNIPSETSTTTSPDVTALNFHRTTSCCPLNVTCRFSLDFFSNTLSLSCNPSYDAMEMMIVFFFLCVCENWNLDCALKCSACEM